jgi:hypothetical protein
MFGGYLETFPPRPQILLGRRRSCLGGVWALLLLVRLARMLMLLLLLRDVVMGSSWSGGRHCGE